MSEEKPQKMYGVGFNFNSLPPSELKDIIKNSDDSTAVSSAKTALDELEHPPFNPPPEPQKPIDSPNLASDYSSRLSFTPNLFHEPLENNKKLVLSLLFIPSFLLVLAIAWQNNGLRFDLIIPYLLCSFVISYVLYLALLILYWVVVIAVIITIAAIGFFVISVISSLFTENPTKTHVIHQTISKNQNIVHK
jgi:hypothetical protein